MKRIYNTSEGQKHFVYVTKRLRFVTFFMPKSFACFFFGNNINTYIIGEGENNMKRKRPVSRSPLSKTNLLRKILENPEKCKKMLIIPSKENKKHE
ncbi:hypothetical protein [uncultured Catenibacterium sp.]|uniref:hypothetical protein n=1 Tax=uncultured Catenibacterium sp. TaxID=286142 RepID=UPI00262CEDD7|nr:hypothetical protein [uncultured Catenibacterium sp.]